MIFPFGQFNAIETGVHNLKILLGSSMFKDLKKNWTAYWP
ncbi:hypothetical protein EHF_0822 [Ehrlichia japonica]|uniref:Uncharacterized protein n=1 Tax=Ehrlichia japonica TaxID=391036 RepID=X5H1C8_9RICK|nr:hypothetical protein EHF_0822 [Ehrlichia japonica]